MARNARAGTLSLIAFGVLALSGTQARAITSTAAFAISVTVQSSCQVSTSALSFGTYTGALGLASATLTLTCTDSTSYNVGLSAGSTTGAAVGKRQMASGTGRLAYALFSDSGRSVNWGETVGTDTVAGRGCGLAQALTLYGRVAAGQLVQPGIYSDTIIATVTY